MEGKVDRQMEATVLPTDRSRKPLEPALTTGQLDPLRHPEPLLTVENVPRNRPVRPDQSSVSSGHLRQNRPRPATDPGPTGPRYGSNQSIANDRTCTVISEQFQQTGIWGAPVQDHHGTHTCVQRVQGRFCLGDHTASHNSLFGQFTDVICG